MHNTILAAFRELIIPTSTPKPARIICGFFISKNIFEISLRAAISARRFFKNKWLKSCQIRIQVVSLYQQTHKDKMKPLTAEQLQTIRNTCVSLQNWAYLASQTPDSTCKYTTEEAEKQVRDHIEYLNQIVK